MKSSSSVGLKGKGRGRLIAGLLGLLLSVGYGWEAVNTLPVGSLREPGAAFFPLLVAAFMFLASAAVVGEQLRLRRMQGAPLDLPGGSDLRRLVLMAITIFGFVWLVSLVGFLVASVLMSLALVRLLKLGSWLVTVVAGLAIALSTYALFVLILNVPLPTGDLW